MAFVLRKKSAPGDRIVPGRSAVPDAPGAVWSPQVPGQVPDRSEVPGEGVLPVPPAEDPHPPRTEFGTAQRIMHMFAPADGNEDDPARFEMRPPSYEEQRKAYPALRTPARPTEGYQLADGSRLAIGAPAIEDEAGEPSAGQ